LGDGIRRENLLKGFYPENLLTYYDRKKILHQMSLISMNHTRDIDDLSGQKLIFWLFKNVRDVSYYSMDIEK